MTPPFAKLASQCRRGKSYQCTVSNENVLALIAWATEAREMALEEASDLIMTRASGSPVVNAQRTALAVRALKNAGGSES